MKFNQQQFNTGKFNAGHAFEIPGIVYWVYAGDNAGGPIDYSTPVAMVSGLTWDGPPLTPGSAKRYGVRTHSTRTGLTEHNTDAQVWIVVDDDGVDISKLPPAPVGLTAAAKSGGTALIEWSYPYQQLAALPLGFHVYLTPGTTPDYTTPAATVAYGPSLLPPGYQQAQPGNYRSLLTGLTHATAYVVAVRAYTAIGEETNPVYVAVTGDTQAPDNVENLTATLTSG